VRIWSLRIAPLVLLGLVSWVVSRGALPPADFSFVNETEVESLDPAKATGRPEHRLICALFEALVNYDPQTLEPLPGVAERWELSDDRCDYTFHLRPDARWSDGRPFVASDFAYTFRRFLDPRIESRNAYQLWYVRNAKRYSLSQVSPGDAVEVELVSRPADSLPFARGELLRGKLIDVEQPSPHADKPPPKIYRVEIDGAERRFQAGAGAASPDNAGKGPAVENCQLVTLDFREVGIQAIDDRTLRLSLERPTPFFLHLIGLFFLSPVPPHVVDRYGFPGWIKPAHIVSNGAYIMTERRIRDRIRLAKNAHYWNREHVALQTIDALSVDAETTALNMYLTGTTDWIPNVPSIVIGDLRKQQRADFLTAPELTVNFYRFNTTAPPLDNRLVRKALALAIDRNEIVERVTRTGEQPALSLVPPGIVGYTSAERMAYDPAAARKLLAEAGFHDGAGLPPIKILYNQGPDVHAAVAQIIQDQWKRHLGINVTLQSLEWGSYLSNIRLMEYQACRSGWVGDYPDPNTFLDLFLTGGTNNNTGYSSPEFDRLLAAAGAESDPARRFAILHDAEALLLDDAPVVPLYFRVSRNMVSPRVRGFTTNLLDVHPLDRMSIDASR
jgi:oligopeptide transport system substrate-binding protein